MISKKILSFILILSIIWINSINIINYIYSQGNILTIDNAVKYTQAISKNYKNKIRSMKDKKVSLEQAEIAVKEARRKETTIRFSLPFDIKLPEGHAMPKEIDLLTKIPKIQKDIKDMTQELEDMIRANRLKAENAFLDVYENERKYQMAEKVLKEMQTQSDKAQKQIKFGKVSQKDIDSLNVKIQAQITKVSGLMQRLITSKEKLSSLVGFNVEGYSFSNPLKMVDIDRSYFDSILNYTLNKDFKLYKTRSAENIARRNVDEIYGIYKKRWGEITQKIESDVKHGGAVDIDRLLEKYESLLVDIDKPWEGDYVINLLLFKVNIPKEWFKREFDGQRYFDDKNRAIVEAIVEKSEAIDETQSVEQELRTRVKDEFDMLKSLYKTYVASVEASKLFKRNYDKERVLFKQGESSAEGLDMEGTNMQTAQETEFENLVAYNKQLVQFDRLTCGAISSLGKSANTFLQVAQIAISNTELEELMGDTYNSGQDIFYYIDNIVDQLRTNFGIIIPESYPQKITHFELMTPDKARIGDRTEIAKTIPVLPLEYKGSTELIVRMYNESEFVAEGSFDGTSIKGKLILNNPGIAAEDPELNEGTSSEEVAEEKQVLGTYSISNTVGGLKKEISFDISQAGVLYYRIVDKAGKHLGEQDKYYLVNESFSHLNFTLSDLSKLVVELYDTNKVLKFKTIFNESSNQIIVE